MENMRVHFYCAVALLFIGHVCGFTRYKESKCFPNVSYNYAIDLSCSDHSVIHVLKETYLNSSSSDTCKPDYNKCRGLEVESTTLSSTATYYRLETVCNGKTKCTEYLDPSYFNCMGRRFGRVDYECIPDMVNYNMCDNLTATSKINQSVFFLASPKSRIPHSVQCECEIHGNNMRVQLVDFSANTTDKEKWTLNISSDSLLNYSISSSTTIKRLVNNVLERVHQTVHVHYYSENTSHQNIWIELIGTKDVQMNMTCGTPTYPTTQNTPHTLQTSTSNPPTSSNSINAAETSSTSNSGNTNTQTPTWTTTPTPSLSGSTTLSLSASVEPDTSTEVTTNMSMGYSSDREAESDHQTILISVSVVAAVVVFTTVAVAVCIVRRKRRNYFRSIDNITIKTNNNLYSDSEVSPKDKSSNDYSEINVDDLEPDVTNGLGLAARHTVDQVVCSNHYWTVESRDLENENTYNCNARNNNTGRNGAVNTSYSEDSKTPFPKEDKTKINVEVEVLAHDMPAGRQDNTQQERKRPHIKPRKSQAAVSNPDACNDGSGYISSEFADNNIPKKNSDHAFNDKHSTNTECGSTCCPDEHMTDNYLYTMEYNNRIPEEGVVLTPNLHVMPRKQMFILQDKTRTPLDKQHDGHQTCVRDKDMTSNTGYDTRDSKERTVPQLSKSEDSDQGKPDHRPQCVPDKEMKINDIYFIEHDDQNSILADSSDGGNEIRETYS